MDSFRFIRTSQFSEEVEGDSFDSLDYPRIFDQGMLSPLSNPSPVTVRQWHFQGPSRGDSPTAEVGHGAGVPWHSPQTEMMVSFPTDGVQPQARSRSCDDCRSFAYARPEVGCDSFVTSTILGAEGQTTGAAAAVDARGCNSTLLAQTSLMAATSVSVARNKLEGMVGSLSLRRPSLPPQTLPLRPPSPAPALTFHELREQVWLKQQQQPYQSPEARYQDDDIPRFVRSSSPPHSFVRQSPVPKRNKNRSASLMQVTTPANQFFESGSGTPFGATHVTMVENAEDIPPPAYSHLDPIDNRHVQARAMLATPSSRSEEHSQQQQQQPPHAYPLETFVGGHGHLVSYQAGENVSSVLHPGQEMINLDAGADDGGDDTAQRRRRRRSVRLASGSGEETDPKWPASILPQNMGRQLKENMNCSILLTGVFIIVVVMVLYHIVYLVGSHNSFSSRPRWMSMTMATSEKRARQEELMEHPYLSHNGQRELKDYYPKIERKYHCDKWPDMRLPDWIHPLHYDLYMEPNMSTFVNRGQVNIFLDLSQPTNYLVLHSKKLNLSDIWLFELKDELVRRNNHTINVHNLFMFDPFYYYRNRVIPLVDIIECHTMEQVVLVFEHELLTTKQYILSMSFERQLDDQLEGFYISSYQKAATGERRYLLTTHFEPTLARSAFPCFDEPAKKATFRLAMLHEVGYQVYFNTERTFGQYLRQKPIGSVSQASTHKGLVSEGIPDEAKHPIYPNDNPLRVMSYFRETVPMSTYLVAFVVCDFEVSSHKTSNGIEIRALAPRQQPGRMSTTYGLDSAAKILAYFEDFFKLDYPLRKLDLVAVPDFGAGAMENWGLITFRLTALLYSEKESSIEIQEQVAVVVAHEIAHQWFGNLVTMNWWNELWLNEGFASYVENLGVDHIHPEWRMLDQFVVSTTQQALAVDSLISSHPINTSVTNPSDIEAIFDMISYKKGSCLIQMIEAFMGREALRAGLEIYLQRFKYQTAKTSDLWQCFSEVSTELPTGLDVASIMNTWVCQAGYPVVEVRWDGGGQFLHIEQRRFISSIGPDDFERQRRPNNTLDYVWIIPVTIVSPSNQTYGQVYWLQTRSLLVEVDQTTNQWLKVNYNQNGYYRVNYEESLWRALIDVLRSAERSAGRHHELGPADRASLIDDAFSLMRIGYLDVEIALDLTRYLEFGEPDYVPWETFLAHVGLMDAIMLQSPQLHLYVVRTLSNAVRRLGWHPAANETSFDKKLRAILLRAAVYYGHIETIERAKMMFDEWMHSGVTVEANLREVVYNTGVQHGGYREWKYVYQHYLTATIPSEKRLLLTALGSTRIHYLLNHLMNISLAKSSIRTQDTSGVIQTVARNPAGRELAWTFVQANWPRFLAILGTGSFSIDAIISETTWHFFEPNQYEAVANFFGRVEVGSGKQAVQQSLEKIKANIYWKANIEWKVIKWLERVADEEGME